MSEEINSWCSQQRVDYHAGKRSKQQIEKLESIGFVWDQEEADFQEMVKELEAFKKKHGHCDVPENYISARGEKNEE